MYLYRDYISSRFGQVNKTEGPIPITDKGTWYTIFGDNTLKSWRGPFKSFGFKHIVLDTDYENYAISYGCDNYFGIFHGRWATLLSREMYAEG